MFLDKKVTSITPAQAAGEQDSPRPTKTSAAHGIYHNLLSPPTTIMYRFELALRQYIAAFDGTNSISPEEFKSRFDNLFHKDFNFLPKLVTTWKCVEGHWVCYRNTQRPLPRNEVFVLEANKLGFTLERLA